MTSLTISQASASFDIRPRAQEIQALADCGGFLLWERDGLVGKIPNVVLRDFVTTYLAYEMMRQRGRLPELPAAAYTLSWDQVENVRCQ